MSGTGQKVIDWSQMSANIYTQGREIYKYKICSVYNKYITKHQPITNNVCII